MSTPAAAETPTAPTAPAGTPAEFTLAAFRKGEMTAKGESIQPALPAETKPAVEEPPDPEVEADPDLRAAIDEIEAPTDNETPAEKGARTRKHKEAARRGYQTRLTNKAARLERENMDLRQRLDQPAPPASERRPADAAPRPAVPVETDPRDPEPTLESVTAKYPDDPDPYARFQREAAAWDRRQERRQEWAHHQDEQAMARATQARTKLNQHAEHGRGVYRDYDAKLITLGQLLQGHPADEVLADAFAGIDDPKVGGELLYRLASKLDDLKTAVSGGQASLLRLIGRLERDITAAAAPTKDPPAAPAVSSAPAPHIPVAAAATVAPVDPAKRSGTELSLHEMREWAATHGSRRS